jgi:hypothetical protein
MKSKNPQAFWLRWMGASILYAFAYTSFWRSNTWLFQNWYGFPLFNLVSGMVLASVQYWAMPLTMRPNAKRWFSVSVISQLVAVSLHTLIVQSSIPDPSSMLMWFSLFVLPALAQSWALSEHFKKAWIFGLASFLPMLLLFGQFPFPEIYQNYFLFEIVVHLLRALAVGGSLVYLQKYQRKESSSFDESSHERLAIRNEEEEASHEEIMRLAQQKQS